MIGRKFSIFPSSIFQLYSYQNHPCRSKKASANNFSQKMTSFSSKTSHEKPYRLPLHWENPKKKFFQFLCLQPSASSTWCKMGNIHCTEKFFTCIWGRIWWAIHFFVYISKNVLTPNENSVFDSGRKFSKFFFSIFHLSSHQNNPCRSTKASRTIFSWKMTSFQLQNVMQKTHRQYPCWENPYFLFSCFQHSKSFTPIL